MYSICVCVYNALPAYIEDIYLYICIFNTNRRGVWMKEDTSV